MQNSKHNIRNTKNEQRVTSHEPRNSAGSALILTVVLTSLLAIVGVLFLMMARINKITASSISKNKELDSAVDTVIAKISESLVQDVPGVAGAGYYDYPGPEDKWLASLEPYRDLLDTSDPTIYCTYYWSQISDVTGFLKSRGFSTQHINVDPQPPMGPPTQDVIREYPDIELDASGNLKEQLADADGDGIADSKWIQLDDITSSSGKPIYAAIRIIDNSGMVNINTADVFDPTSTDANRIDGSTQMQINLAGLLKTGSLQPSDTIDNLHSTRCGSGASDWGSFNQNVIWQYGEPNGGYLPFDISDELELRYRYCIDSQFKSRFEANLPNTAKTYGNPGSLYDGSSNWGLSNWLGRIPEPNYIDRRHLLTTYNMDRIITPDCNKMTNINTADVNALYSNIRRGLLDANVNFQDVNRVSAQFAVNIIDYRDNDSSVTVYPNLDDGKTYYGFEAQPFISEIAAIIDASDSSKNSYALELYNPFNIPVSLGGFILSIDSVPVVDITLSGTIDPNGYFVISSDSSKFAGQQIAPALKFSGNYMDNLPPPGFDSWANYNLTLKRTVGDSNIILDVQQTNNVWFVPAAPAVFYAQRDTSNWHIVYQTMNGVGSAGTLGASNTTSISGNNYNLSLANKAFVTVGDIARPLIIGPNTTADGTIGRQLASAVSESQVRLNLADPNFQQIFKYLAVFDPAVYSWNDPNETRIKGRININTAPWFVLAQLPWVKLRKGNYDSNSLAQAIVAYRDKQNLSTSGGPDYSNRLDANGFGSIGQLCNVIGGSNQNFWIDYYSRAVDAIGDQTDFPDLTPADGAADDFEERDLIFARISNLITVRSDVFTAYILVRIGTDGPQKRVIAIFDRSNVKSSADGRMKVLAVQPAADPR